MSQSLQRAPGRAANIFINYRREDSAGYAGRLFDRLNQHFPGRVFMDIDTIKPGVDFVDVIEQAVGSCEVLLVIIGHEWLSVTDASGQRRLDNPDDFVRLEVSGALKRNVRVIPVLVQDAPMPRTDELPPDLARLARHNAIELSDTRWGYDVDRLIETIEEVLRERECDDGKTARPPSAPARSGRTGAKSWAPLLMILAAVALAATGWMAWKSRSDDASDGSTALPTSEGDYGPDTCRPGFVWREARPEDHVCVTPETRDQTVFDNRSAAERRDPAGGPYGPETCLQGYVWRNAFENDRVCVTPETRQQAADDNASASERRQSGTTES